MDSKATSCRRQKCRKCDQMVSYSAFNRHKNPGVCPPCRFDADRVVSSGSSTPVISSQVSIPSLVYNIPDKKPKSNSILEVSDTMVDDGYEVYMIIMTMNDIETSSDSDDELDLFNSEEVQQTEDHKQPNMPVALAPEESVKLQPLES